MKFKLFLLLIYKVQVLVHVICSCYTFRFQKNAVNGHILIQLSKLNKRSPDKVLEILKDSFGLDMLHSLHVASVIGKLTAD